uniref:HMG box domain-containing protein n=1 Tax=Schizophyllum commune (strain H4-8 / FGSC 9210) TaxID=578458 RepID=D8QGP4_SCHCM
MVPALIGRVGVSFIKSECAAEIREGLAPESDQRAFVKTAAKKWSVMTPAERQPFVEQAKQINAEHRAKNPNFQYFSSESRTKKRARQTAKRQEKQRTMEAQRRATEKRASRSRTTSTTPPGPATPSPIHRQTINPATAQMPPHAEALYWTALGASSSELPQGHPSQQLFSAQEYPIHNDFQQACHRPAQQQLHAHQLHQNGAPQPSTQPAATSQEFSEYRNGAQNNDLFAPAGPYDDVLSSQSSSHAAFLESNGIPISNVSGDIAFSGPLDDVAFTGLSDNATLFGGSGFALSGMANEAPHYGTHDGFGYAAEFSAAPSSQQPQPQAYSAQADISLLTRPILPLEVPPTSQDASTASQNVAYISPELAIIPLRRSKWSQPRLEGAQETVPSIPVANGPSSRKPSPEEHAAPPRGYLRAPHEYTEQDHLHDNASSPNELNAPSHAPSFPQATASSHRRTVSSSSCWPMMRNFRKHQRFCSDTPITQPSVQRTGDWLTDWQASGLANAQPNLTWRPQLDAFANAPLESLAALRTPPTAPDALHANVQPAAYGAQETCPYMGALPTSHANAPAPSWIQAPMSSYKQPTTASYTDAQTRSYVEPLTTSSSQAPAFPPAPGLSYTQPSTSYEQGSAQSYPDPAMQPYSSAQTQPYPSAPTQPYSNASLDPDALLDPYSQASALPFPDAPIPPHPDLTTPYYEPVNHRYETRLGHC